VLVVVREADAHEGAGVSSSVNRLPVWKWTLWVSAARSHASTSIDTLQRRTIS
jgi:hypothetical protein